MNSRGRMSRLRSKTRRISQKAKSATMTPPTPTTSRYPPRKTRQAQEEPISYVGYGNGSQNQLDMILRILQSLRSFSTSCLDL